MKLHALKKKSFDELNATAQKYISMPYFHVKLISGDCFCNHLVLGIIRSNFYLPFFQKKWWKTESIVECRSAEISAVNLEGFPSFWSWKCFNVIVLLCLCMIFSAELREETKQWLKWVSIRWGTGKHYHGVVSSFMFGSWISSCLLCELILFEESICLY